MYSQSQNHSVKFKVSSITVSIMLILISWLFLFAIEIDADYPDATWVPADPSNYTDSNRESSYDIRWVVIHTVQGSYEGCIAWFQNPSADCSAHYVVSQEGEITCMVHDEDIAWHAGNWNYNCHSIGIEHEGYVDDPNAYTDAMYQASANLVRWLCEQYDIAMVHPTGVQPASATDSSGIIGHDQVPDPNDPTVGGGAGHHTDPGPYWNWDYFMDLVTGTTPTPALDATFHDQSYPSVMEAGEEYIVWVEYTNTGTATWYPAGDNPVRLGTWNPQDHASPFYTDYNWVGPNRPTDVDHTTAPGEIGRFTFIMTAPAVADQYFDEYWRPLQEGVSWFGPELTHWQIHVQDTVAPPAPTIVSAPAGVIDTPTPYFDWADGYDVTGISKYCCRIDNEPVPDATPGYEYEVYINNVGSESSQHTVTTPLSEGMHYYFIYQCDGANHWSPYSTGEFIIDLSAPAPPNVISAPEAYTSDPTPYFDWEDGIDPNGIALYRVVVDNEPEPDTTVGYEYERIIGDDEPLSSEVECDVALPEGMHYYFITQQDTVGKWSTPATGTFMIDLTPPSTPVPPTIDTDIPVSYISNTTIRWVWENAEDAGAGIKGYYVSIGTAPLGSDVVQDDFVTDNSYVISGLIDAVTYYCKIKAEDYAGLQSDYSPSSAGVTVDISPPTITDISDKFVDATTEWISFEANVEDKSSGVANVTLYWKYDFEPTYRGAEMIHVGEDIYKLKYAPPELDYTDGATTTTLFIQYYITAMDRAYPYHNIARYPLSGTCTIRVELPSWEEDAEVSTMPLLGDNLGPVTTLLYPTDNAYISPFNVRLYWYSEDPEHDLPIYHDVYFGVNKSLVAAHAPSTCIAEHIVTTYYDLGDLHANNGTTYYWTVVPTDTNGNIGNCTQSSPWCFTISTAAPRNQIPVVELITPTNGEMTTTLDVELRWAADDPDSSLLTYDLYLGINKLKVQRHDNAVLVGTNIMSTYYTVLGLRDNTTYYWTVVPHDSLAMGICISGVWKFTVDTSYVPTYAVRLLFETAKITLAPGCVGRYNLTVVNDGTTTDRITLRIITELNTDYRTAVSLEQTTITLARTEAINIILTVIIPTTIEVGNYTIIITAESADGKLTDTLTIPVEVLKNYYLADKISRERAGAQNLIVALAHIICCIIILIIILIMMVIVINRKLKKVRSSLVETEKGMEEEILSPLPQEPRELSSELMVPYRVPPELYPSPYSQYPILSPGESPYSYSIEGYRYKPQIDRLPQLPPFFCPRCGTAVIKPAKYCINCGEALAD